LEARHAAAAAGLGGPAARPRLEAASPRYGEKVIKGLLAVCAGLSIVTTVAIVASLIGPTLEFFGEVGVFDFLFGTTWSPTIAPESYGVLPIVLGTLSVTLWGLIVAVPVGIGAAIYLSEYARPRVRRVLKPALEVLAGIPTVAFGFFAFTFVTPLLQDIWPGFLGDPPNIFNAGAAGLAIGLLIVPIIASISEDGMSAVPGGLREGAYALGASRMRVALGVVAPAALSGIVASIVLGVSRAVGETMVVLMAAGNTPFLGITFSEAVQAITAYIGVVATGDISTQSFEYNTIFAVGLLLFVITLVMNLVSIRLVRRYREVYE
jgi:phosphate transport system permease protein